ncbi:MAG: dihydrolipoyllysine-residue acetyltransferase [Dokdonella sp.]|uniref:dihydrolipoyllysine-residue acetyltransferase n=1 Tax=Dokdonella sp. TaxID=2291710 RepID=UPI0025C6ACC2|nr:dihydrolipoyllysine-residue acetyltransferase [Dokdonella sp.]MBX3702064.1 dihydrolipoyllysine-residue acetyltransferase [Dokdonella sp.]
MATHEIKVPDIGNYHGIPVIEVLVKPGEQVRKDQGLVTLESDKATMEVPATVDGVVQSIMVKVGDEVSEGHVVAIVEAAGAGAAAPAAAPAPAPAAAPAAATPRPRVAAAEGDPQPSPAAAATPAAAARSAPPPVAAGTATPAQLPYAGPAVRRFARELGVDLAQVKGSERKGRISKEDVQNFVKAALAGGGGAGGAAMAVGNGLNLLPWPVVDFARFGEIETRPLPRIKKISGANLARNWAMIPHVTQFDAADVTELEALRVALNKENEKAGIKLTMLAFLIKAVVAALKRYPDFNSSLDASGENLTLKKYFHIGFAADTPNGLVVPVLKDADRKGVIELAQESAELARKARDGKLGPADMQGGCFSISSLGGIGGTAFTPIVNAPEVAILGVSKAALQPVWNGDKFKPRLMLPLSLSYDHRVIDGAAAARFTNFLAQALADMRRVLL